MMHLNSLQYNKGEEGKSNLDSFVEDSTEVGNGGDENIEGAKEQIFNPETGEVNLSGKTLEEIDDFFDGFTSEFRLLDLSGSGVTYDRLKENVSKFTFITELDIRDTNLIDNSFLLDLRNLKKLYTSGFFPLHFYNDEEHEGIYPNLEETYYENFNKGDKSSIEGVKGFGKKGFFVTIMSPN